MVWIYIYIYLLTCSIITAFYMKTKIMSTEKHSFDTDTETVRFCLPWFSHQFKWRQQPRNQDKAETQKGSDGRFREHHQEQRYVLRDQGCHPQPPIPNYYVWILKMECKGLIGKKRFIWNMCWRRAVWITWTHRKASEWVLEQIRTETLLEAKVTNWKLSYFGHTVRRQSPLERTIIQEK